MRQMLFIKQLLIERFDFKVFLEHECCISHPKALDLLSLVDASYRLKLYIPVIFQNACISNLLGSSYAS